MRIFNFIIALQFFATHTSWGSPTSDRYDQRVSEINSRIDRAQLDLAFADRIREGAEFIASLNGQTRCIEGVIKVRSDFGSCISHVSSKLSYGESVLGRVDFAAKNARDPNLRASAVVIRDEIEQAVTSLRKSIVFAHSAVDKAPYLESFKLLNKQGRDVTEDFLKRSFVTPQHSWLPQIKVPISRSDEIISSEPAYVIQGLENKKARQSFCSLKTKEVAEGKRRYEAEFEKALNIGDLFAMRAAYAKTKALKIGMDALAEYCEQPPTHSRRVIGGTSLLPVKSSSLNKELGNSLEAMKQAVERKTPADMLERACGLLQGIAASELNKTCNNNVVNPYVEYVIHLGLSGALSRTGGIP